ncbi:hypothetical protein ISN45_At01g015240 [Arabidopsis thaliana x Arabidopsis arenosa]|uniref:Uncharacterized protein n=2 Tax=Arabidopsis TaxID=3701 RepID=A0A8T2H6B5_ARASU|nr:hypothetical protein ISN45_At01g015240 [Arabidopsis thaliana x Arabidopsis arenosa]KAG7654354.1 hypothetical protein ISN44_As01g015420 [Arabidopsis suecica]
MNENVRKKIEVVAGVELSCLHKAFDILLIFRLCGL